MSRSFLPLIVLFAFALFVAGCGNEKQAAPPTKSNNEVAGIADKLNAVSATSTPKDGNSSGSQAADAASDAQDKTVDKAKAASQSAGSTSPASPGTGNTTHSLIAWDEFDGVNRGGWKEPGLGTWGKIGKERNGALVVAGNALEARELAQPVSTGVVWYAVTFRMGSKISGNAHVVPSPDGKQQYSNLGFSAKSKPYTSHGFWLDPNRDTRIENTELQTMLTWYNFEFGESLGYAAKDFGLALLAEGNIITRKPRFNSEGSFRARKLSHLIITKEGKEELIIERVAIARTLQDVLNPPHLAELRKKEASAASSDTANPAQPEGSAPVSAATDKPKAEPKPSGPVPAPKP